MTMLTPETPASREVSDPIIELLLGHARELIAVVLEAKVQLMLKQLRGDGRDVVRNGYLPGRLVTTAVGDVKAHGVETGHHVHLLDHVVVPLTTGTLRLETEGAALTTYWRPTTPTPVVRDLLTTPSTSTTSSFVLSKLY